MTKENFWYDYDKICGFNAMFNFIISDRGCGKSYGATKMVIQDFIKNGNEFVYLRRYKTELMKAIPKFFDAVVKNGEFPDYEFKCEGLKFYIKGVDDGPKGWIKFGEAAALSTSSILKSSNFANVRTILFDEFLIGSGVFRYLNNEVETLLDAVESIARLRDNVRVFFLGNAISVTNPYFAYFDLSLPYNSEFKSFRDGLIVVNYAKNPAYRDKKHNSKFGRLIAGTDWADYAIESEWLEDNDSFIGSKDGSSKNYSVIVLNGHKYGFWKSRVDGRTFVSKDFDPKNPCLFSFDEKDHKEENILLSAKKSPWFKMIIDSYKIGNVWFEDQNVKNEFLRVLSKSF